MLETLDEVDWGRFHHAYGAANDVPALLRVLAWPEQPPPGFVPRPGMTALLTAARMLRSNVHHQGSVWGVSAKVIPFLFELLREDEVPLASKQFIVPYLHDLALGHAQQQFPERFDIEGLEAGAAEVEALNLPQSVLDGDAFGELPKGVTADAAGRVGAVWVRDCYRGVESRVTELLPFLAHEDEALVSSTVALLASFPRMAKKVAPGLWMMTKEVSPTAGMALVSLAQLGVPGVAEAARVLSDAASGVTSLYAAVADGLASGAQLSPSSRLRLRSAAPSQEACPFTGSLAVLVARVLERVPREEPGEAALPARR